MGTAGMMMAPSRRRLLAILVLLASISSARAFVPPPPPRGLAARGVVQVRSHGLKIYGLYSLFGAAAPPLNRSIKSIRRRRQPHILIYIHINPRTPHPQARGLGSLGSASSSGGSVALGGLRGGSKKRGRGFGWRNVLGHGGGAWVLMNQSVDTHTKAIGKRGWTRTTKSPAGGGAGLFIQTAALTVMVD
jgi:hypothetical protein